MNQLTEAEIQQQILLALGSRPDCTVWRNNVGAARTYSGQVVRFGTKGAADIIGIVCMPAPSGGCLGRFIAIE
ncbi:MAG: hypothetical protein ACK4N5_01775, partial [Myxococcales bacterium]